MYIIEFLITIWAHQSVSMSARRTSIRSTRDVKSFQAIAWNGTNNSKQTREKQKETQNEQTDK